MSVAVLRAVTFLFTRVPAIYFALQMVPPEEKRCPGSWCAQDPDRIYPDGRGEWPAGPKFELTWGACNIAIQDC